MKESHKGLYNELAGNVNNARLKELSIEIISRYKRKDHRFLSGLAETIGISSSESDMSSLFAKIIQLYHPDKLGKITSDLEEYYATGNTDALIRMKNIYLVDIKKTARIPDYTFEDDSEYFYEEDGADLDEFEDYSYDEDEGDAGYEEDEEFPDEDEYGFIEAVNDLYLGNLEYELSIPDLQNLEGELDLSGFDIDDLTGAEHCVNITLLNLSGNRLVKIGLLAGLERLESLYLSGNNIEDISCLGSLTELREIDISFNQVEDVSVLLLLPGLKYANLIANPIRDRSVIDRLSEKGVIVIFQ